MPEHKRVAFAAFHILDDAQLWFHRMELNSCRPTWVQFIQLVNARFGPPLTDSLISELTMLRRTEMVDELSKLFITLSNRDTSLTEAQQIQLFIIGLGDPLCTDVTLQQPLSLDDTMIFAWAYEQHNASCDGTQTTLTHNYSKPTVKLALLTSSLPLPGATNATIPTNIL
jgi:hypothetical protein